MVYIFSCGEADNSSIGELVLPPAFRTKRAYIIQTWYHTCMYVVWAMNFKSEVRLDLRGCLETKVASKPLFCKLLLKSGSFSDKVKRNGCLLMKYKFLIKLSPKILVNYQKVEFSISLISATTLFGPNLVYGMVHHFSPSQGVGKPGVGGPFIKAHFY